MKSYAIFRRIELESMDILNMIKSNKKLSYSYINKHTQWDIFYMKHGDQRAL